MATRYNEVLIEGPRGRTQGFIEGYIAGRGLQGQVLSAEDEGFGCETLRERLQDLSPFSGETIHLLVPQKSMASVERALTEAADVGLELKLHASREVKGARFGFKFTIYSREHGERIQAFFEELPEGVTLTTEEGFREDIHPGDEGTSTAGYAPAHQYALSARGVVEGELEGVLTLYRLCRAEDLIREEPAELIE